MIYLTFADLLQQDKIDKDETDISTHITAAGNQFMVFVSAWNQLMAVQCLQPVAEKAVRNFRFRAKAS